MKKFVILPLMLIVGMYTSLMCNGSGAVEDESIVHGRSAAKAFLTMNPDQFKVGDYISVVRSRDKKCKVRPKVSYVGIVYLDKHGEKAVKKATKKS